MSKLPKRKTIKSTRNYYQDYRYILPVNDYRYVRIFEDIIIKCGERLVWTKVSGVDLPKVSIGPLDTCPKFIATGRSLVERTASGNYMVQIPISVEMIDIIRHNLGYSNYDKMKYIIMSDTKEKNLRIFFPNKNVVGKIIHVGFYHKNFPGALDEILSMVSKSNFNILTGILRTGSSVEGEGETVADIAVERVRERNDKKKESIWEAVLEYRGSMDLSEIEKDSLYRLIADRINMLPDLVGNKSKFNIKVGAPMYPRSPGIYSKERHNIYGHMKKPDSEYGNRGRLVSIDNSLESIEKSDAANKYKTVSLLRRIKRRIEKDDRPTVFLSYSHYAKAQANEVRRELGNTYEFDEYQYPDSNPIIEKVRDKIQECDYFIGIWHHDLNFPRVKKGNSQIKISSSTKYSISPWMFFEYGIAVDDGKKVIIVHSSKVHEKVSRRISPGISHLSYKGRRIGIENIEIIRQKMFEYFSELKS
ncbi:MAG: hypothetical protein AAGG50_12535 [Bacteroidota bacterium]